MAITDDSVLSRFQRENHNHTRCVASALSSAKRICDARDARLTDIRRRILELVWSAHSPVVAYDLLERLRPEKANATPATVYRALEFLLAHGLIHRIESKNAYVGCPAPEKPHTGQFLICGACESVAELDSDEILKLIDGQAKALGFEAQAHTIEISGLCASCRKKAK